MSNRYRQLLSLTNTSSRTVAEVASNNADGTSTVQLSSGAFITVFGTSVAAGSKAYIENGRIIGQAADLPYSEIEV